MQVHIQKLRFKEVGSPGMAELRFNRLNGRYEELMPHPDIWVESQKLMSKTGRELGLDVQKGVFRDR